MYTHRQGNLAFLACSCFLRQPAQRWHTLSLLQPTAPTTSMTTATHNPTFITDTNANCSAVARCVANVNCSDCLKGINVSTFPHSGASLTPAAARAKNVGFFRSLLTTAKCLPKSTPPDILGPALTDLCEPFVIYCQLGGHPNPCMNRFGMTTTSCIFTEYACFLNPHCRECFAALILATRHNATRHNDSKVAALNSTACANTPPVLLTDLSFRCEGTKRCFFRKPTSGLVYA